MSESTDTSVAASNADCEQIDKVTVVLQWVAQAQFAGYFAAADEGYYADQCLDVTIQEGGTNVVPQQVLASGNAQFAVSHVVKSMASREEGADIVNISQVFQRGAYLEVAWADSGIETLQDFTGKKVGSWGAGNDLTLRAALEGEGVDFDKDFEIVQQPFDMSLLLNREADVVQAKTYNEFAQLLETVNPDTGELYQPEDFSVINLQELGYQTLEDGVYSSSKWLEEGDNADVAARFLAATYEGWAFCRDDAESCVQSVLDRGSALGATHQTWMMNEVNKLIWPNPNGEAIGTLDPDAWDQTIEVAMGGGVLSEAPDDGASRSDIHEAALKLLEDTDVDVVGDDFEPIEVELTEGGK
ncbi:ABC transporter substrate-binding protein [Leucobacter allii]|uniref:Thiamine pyrimidine synthase n=1 Tax=Leucobacter allii TaxID=2932247 RepID=A0ABY4FN48_9MICO|nr:ABC transporter substrate-binding protein [Leucobacter allii]UOQ57654.1 ABC transporter substrate-binding protein [Leucobacter allii]UOR02197.1 ABC transporter substrate-binding protein [Leucobacter allii]